MKIYLLVAKALSVIQRNNKRLTHMADATCIYGIPLESQWNPNDDDDKLCRTRKCIVRQKVNCTPRPKWQGKSSWTPIDRQIQGHPPRSPGNSTEKQSSVKRSSSTKENEISPKQCSHCRIATPKLSRSPWPGLLT